MQLRAARQLIHRYAHVLGERLGRHYGPARKILDGEPRSASLMQAHDQQMTDNPRHRTIFFGRDLDDFAVQITLHAHAENRLFTGQFTRFCQPLGIWHASVIPTHAEERNKKVLACAAMLGYSSRMQSNTSNDMNRKNKGPSHTRNFKVTSFTAPSDLLEEAEAKAIALGMPLSGYLRYLIAKANGTKEAEALRLGTHFTIVSRAQRLATKPASPKKGD